MLKRGGRGRQAGVDPYLIPRLRRAEEDHRRDEDVWGMPAIWEVRKMEKLLFKPQATFGCKMDNVSLFFPEHDSADVMCGCLAESS